MNGEETRQDLLGPYTPMCVCFIFLFPLITLWTGEPLSRDMLCMTVNISIRYCKDDCSNKNAFEGGRFLTRKKKNTCLFFSNPFSPLINPFHPPCLHKTPPLLACT